MKQFCMLNFDRVHYYRKGLTFINECDGQPTEIGRCRNVFAGPYCLARALS